MSVRFQIECGLVNRCFSGPNCEYEFVIVLALLLWIGPQRHCGKCVRLAHLGWSYEGREDTEPLVSPDFEFRSGPSDLL